MIPDPMTTSGPSDDPAPDDLEDWWYPLGPGEESRPGFQRNPRMCEEGHHWARRLDRRQGRPRYRCPAHDPRHRARVAPPPGWQRRSHVAAPGVVVAPDGRLPVFSYVSVEKTPAYLRAVEAIAQLGSEFHLQVRPEQGRDHLLRKGTDVEQAEEASSDATLDQLVATSSRCSTPAKRYGLPTSTGAGSSISSPTRADWLTRRSAASS